MNDVILQIKGVDRDALYVLFVILGAIVAAVAVKASDNSSALSSLAGGVFFGLLVVLFVTDVYPTLTIRRQVFNSGLAGFCGNWLLHLVVDQRDGWAKSFIKIILRKFMSEEDLPTSGPKQ